MKLKLSLIALSVVVIQSCQQAQNLQQEEVSTSTSQEVSNGYETLPNASTLTLAEHKQLLEEGYPIERVRRAKALFSARHFTVDAMDDLATAEDDALYYFNFMDEFMPSAKVQASPNKFDLARDLNPALAEVSYKDLEGKARPTFQEYINDPKSRLQAAIIIKKGKVVFETYPGMRPEDKHVWMSVSKPLAGVAILDLIDKGQVDPNAPITQYVPRLQGSAWDGVPVKAVLTMTTGLNAADISGNMFKAGTMEQRYYQASFGDLYNGKKEDWIQVIRESKKIAEPYTLYQYASMNTQVLSIAVENITGKKFVDYLYERFFEYAGTGEFVANLFPDGSIHAATAMNSTLEDLARYGLLFTPTFEQITGKEVVSPRLIEYMFENKVPMEVFKNSAVGKMGEMIMGEQVICGSGSQFDFLWEDGAFAKLGHNGQGIYVDPAREVVGVYFSASTELNYPVAYMRAAATALD
ncbi:serine hydrolase domain-containing protein [Persicobacter diffluens]|uniref:Beta-lactamase-related domain-containing protein n=1 Tax=Persicobacter diffluens TaxID=981 RepID=A0AAN4W4K2_9BACT|nr:hypothetical protein PEDI_51130 [Persicobacter diffluens]